MFTSVCCFIDTLGIALCVVSPTHATATTQGTALIVTAALLKCPHPHLRVAPCRGPRVHPPGMYLRSAPVQGQGVLPPPRSQVMEEAMASRGRLWWERTGDPRLAAETQPPPVPASMGCRHKDAQDPPAPYSSRAGGRSPD